MDGIQGAYGPPYVSDVVTQGKLARGL